MSCCPWLHTISVLCRVETKDVRDEAGVERGEVVVLRAMIGGTTSAPSNPTCCCTNPTAIISKTKTMIDLILHGYVQLAAADFSPDDHSMAVVACGIAIKQCRASLHLWGRLADISTINHGQTQRNSQGGRDRVH